MAAYWQIVFKDLTCCRTLCPQWFRLISSWVACKQDALSRKRIYFSFQYFHGNCWLDWSYLEGNASCRAGRNLWMLQQPKRMCFLNVCWLVDWYHVQATPLPNWPRTSMDVHNGEKIWKKFSRVKQPQHEPTWWSRSSRVPSGNLHPDETSDSSAWHFSISPC